MDLGSAPNPGGAGPDPQIPPLSPPAGGRRHRHFHDGSWGGVSLGMFIFVPGDVGPGVRENLLSHEYGHTFQSALLGPLYLLAVGVPSFLWANLPSLERLRRQRSIPYISRYPENWAEALGRRHYPKALPNGPWEEARI